jgi:myo-inositol-1(or 4)-monophosphatase
MYPGDVKIVDTRMIDVGLQAVKTGGAVLKENFGRVPNISYKGKLDLVTDTDLRAEEAVVSILTSKFPKHGILAEERKELPSGSAYRWILDPLDGTTNYAHGYPFFCVSLALEHDRKIVWGAVYDPIKEDLFTAELNRGARLNGQPIKASSTNSLGRSMLCTGFPYDVHESSDNNLNHFENFIKAARAIRRDGSAALDLCYVAMGRFDGFWEIKLRAWDVAAGFLMVTEAGGKVTGLNGMDYDITQRDVLASNSLIHEEMLKVISLETNIDR